MNASLFFVGAVELLILLLALSVHESAHAWAAERCGDSTGRDLGRVSLNPLRHLDPIGSIVLPVLLIFTGGPIFGWAKPTPLVLGNLRNPRRDEMLVTLAGPASNFFLFLAAAGVLGVVVRAMGEEAKDVAQRALLPAFVADLDSPKVPFLFTLVQMAFINGLLAVFNLIPVPPLDGGHIVLNLMPPDWAARYSAVRPFAFMIIMGLVLVGFLAVLVLPIYFFLILVIRL